jgi:hypothetical protein
MLLGVLIGRRPRMSKYEKELRRAARRGYSVVHITVGTTLNRESVVNRRTNDVIHIAESYGFEYVGRGEGTLSPFGLTTGTVVLEFRRPVLADESVTGT